MVAGLFHYNWTSFEKVSNPHHNFFICFLLYLLKRLSKFLFFYLAKSENNFYCFFFLAPPALCLEEVPKAFVP